MLIDWGHMGDLRTTINHRSVSCLKLLNEREQHLCPQTSCGASKKQPNPTWIMGKCFLCSPWLAGSPVQPAPHYRVSPEHGDRAWVSKYLDSQCFQQYFPLKVCRVSCLDTSDWERPEQAVKHAGWMENTMTASAFEANRVWCLTSWFNMGLQPEFLLVSCKGAIWLVMCSNFPFWRLICWKICAADVKSWIFNAFYCCSLFFYYKKTRRSKEHIIAKCISMTSRKFLLVIPLLKDSSVSSSNVAKTELG